MISAFIKKFISLTAALAVFCLCGCSSLNNRDDSHKYDDITILGELDYYGEIVLPKGDMSDHTFVGDELWAFYASDDDHENYSPVYRYKVDLENNKYEYIGKFKHNFGHCNTVDYCAANDTLIMGNGAGENYELDDQIYIIENASGLKDSDSVDIKDVAKIIHLDVAGLDCGQQVNVCWGDSNNGKYNIVYVLSNLSWKKHIRKIMLGTGSNALEYGKKLNVEDGEFNGTFKVLAEFTRDYSTTYCNQGTQYYGGKLYEAIGHDGVYIAVNSLLANGLIATEFIKSYAYDDGGEIVAKTFSEGIAVKDGYLFVGSFNYNVHSKILIYKL